MKILYADFETHEGKVIAWGARCDDDYFRGSDVVKFVELAENYDTVVFHNGSRFDFYFIVLNRTVCDRWTIKYEETNRAIISFEIGRTRFIDSVRFVPLALEEFTEAFGLNTVKLSHMVDYKHMDRVHPAVLFRYLRADVDLLYEAINPWFYELGMDKNITNGGYAAKLLKGLLGKRWYTSYHNKLAPVEHRILRPAYRGGLCAYNEERGKIVKGVSSIDINSSYPSVMLYEPLPYGKPDFKRGLSVAQVRKLIDNPRRYIVVAGYFTGKISDAKLIKLPEMGGYVKLGECDYKYLSGIVDIQIDWVAVFKCDMRLSAYPRKYLKAKENAKTKGERSIAKRYLNVITGKLGQTIDNTKSKINDNRQRVYIDTNETGKEVYLPAAIAILYKARQKLRDAIAIVGDDFVYCDTDSVYYTGDYTEAFKREGMLHPTELGKWDVEVQDLNMKFFKLKSYVLFDDTGKVKVMHMSGISNIVFEHVDDWNSGDKVKDAKLARNIVDEGIDLVDMDVII